jgi:hypothetical protein
MDRFPENFNPIHSPRIFFKWITPNTTGSMCNMMGWYKIEFKNVDFILQRSYNYIDGVNINLPSVKDLKDTTKVRILSHEMWSAEGRNINDVIKLLRDTKTDIIIDIPVLVNKDCWKDIDFKCLNNNTIRRQPVKIVFPNQNRLEYADELIKAIRKLNQIHSGSLLTKA